MCVRSFDCPCDQIVIDVEDRKRTNKHTVEEGQILNEWGDNQLINHDEYYSEQNESKIEKNHRLVRGKLQRDSHCQTKQYC